MRVDIYLHAESEHLEHKLEAILTMGNNIMTAIQDYATKQTAFNTEVSTKLASIGSDLDTVGTNVTALNALISQLQNSSGTITPEDQATLDQLQAAGQTIQTSVDALGTKADALAGITPPVVPAA